MKPYGLLNSKLEEIVTRLGHKQCIVICDAGLPIPPGKEVIDLALLPGVPSFILTLEAIVDNLVVESWACAAEIEENNKDIYVKIVSLMKNYPNKIISHEKFKEMSVNAEAFIRTGECTPYSNIILFGGVTF